MQALEFNGSGAEYFKIWIVNILLTIVTLGIYYPWAKVRNKRYFYGNTELDNHNFEYHATGKQLFISYLIAMAILIFVSILSEFAPVLASSATIAFILGLPWIIWRSIKFNLRMSSYRNVRFGFDGSLGGAYGAFLAYPVGLLIAFGIVFAALFAVVDQATMGMETETEKEMVLDNYKEDWEKEKPELKGNDRYGIPLSYSRAQWETALRDKEARATAEYFGDTVDTEASSEESYSYETNAPELEEWEEEKKKEEPKKKVAVITGDGTRSLRKSAIAASKAELDYKELLARHEIQQRAIGMHKSQIMRREATARLAETQKKERSASKWRNTINFAKQATELEAKNGVITFKDSGILADIVDGFNPVEKTVGEDGIASFQNKQIQGRWVAAGEGKAPKLHLFYPGKDGIEQPVTLPDGNVVSPNRDTLLGLAKIGGLFESEKAMVADDRKRAETETLRVQGLEETETLRGHQLVMNKIKRLSEENAMLMKQAADMTKNDVTVPKWLSDTITMNERNIILYQKQTGATAEYFGETVDTEASSEESYSYETNAPELEEWEKENPARKGNDSNGIPLSYSRAQWETALAKQQGYIDYSGNQGEAETSSELEEWEKENPALKGNDSNGIPLSYSRAQWETALAKQQGYIDYSGNQGEAETSSEYGNVAIILASILALFFYPAYFAMLKKLSNQYFVNGARFGQGELAAELDFKRFFTIALKAMGLGLLLSFLAMIVISALAALFFGFEQIAMIGQQIDQGEEVSDALLLLVVGVYAVLIFVSMYIVAYFKARHRQYIYSQTMLDNAVSFESTLRANTFFGIGITNLLLLIVTFGLAYPWTKVRKYRYCVETIELDATNSFDDYMSQAGHENAFGEELGDAFDVDVGGIAF